MIDLGLAISTLPEEFVKDRSTAQLYAYHIAQAIRSGQVQSHWICQSTPLTNYSPEFLQNLDFKTQVLEQLGLGVNYNIGIYITNWFNIKLNPKWIVVQIICRFIWCL